MSVEVEILNRQRARRVDVRQLRALTEGLLQDELGMASATLGIHLIGARAMALMNWRWLQHEGSTDILTFDHRGSASEPLHGELFICVDDAVAQSAVFRTTVDGELVRYVIHGVLHLMGHDDLEPVARRLMKREENRLVRRVTAGGGVVGLVGLAARKVRRGPRDRFGRGVASPPASGKRTP